MATWSAGRTTNGVPIRRQHCFLPGYKRSLCKKRRTDDELMEPGAGIEPCVACSREAGNRGIPLPEGSIPVPRPAT